MELEYNYVYSVKFDLDKVVNQYGIKVSKYRNSNFWYYSLKKNK